MAEFLPVLLGSDANVYGMARSFYEGYGVRSAALCRRVLPPVRHSRLVRVAMVEPLLEREDVFINTLHAFAAATPGQTRLLVPCADSYALLLAGCAPRLKGLYRFAAPPVVAIRRCGDKKHFAAVCAAFGLRTPATVVVPAGAGAPERLPFGYPVVVKPADSTLFWNCRFPGRRKVFLAQDAATLAGYLAAAASGYRGEMLLQEYIPGGDDALRVVNVYCAPCGAIRLFAAARPLLQERTPEGCGNYAALLAGERCLDALLCRRLTALLKAVKWHGYANFDLKYHAGTGEAILFEMNPRQGRSAYYVTAAGQNLTAPLVAELLDLAEPADFPQTPRPVLWRLAPWGVLRRLTANQALLEHAAALRARGACASQLLSPAEGAVRRAWYCASQLNYYAKTARAMRG